MYSIGIGDYRQHHRYRHIDYIGRPGRSCIGIGIAD